MVMGGPLCDREFLGSGEGTTNPFAFSDVPPSPFPSPFPQPTVQCQSCGEGGLDEEPDLAVNIEIQTWITSCCGCLTRKCWASVEHQETPRYRDIPKPSTI